MKRPHIWMATPVILVIALVLVFLLDRKEADLPTKEETSSGRAEADALVGSRPAGENKSIQKQERELVNEDVTDPGNAKPSASGRGVAWMSDEEFEQLSAFFERRSPSTAASDYDSYSIEQLQSLADENDPEATRILAQRYGLKGDGDRAYQMHLKAAVFGYASSIRAVAAHHSINYTHGGLNDEEAHQEAIDAMAAYRTALKMGGGGAIPSARSFYEHSGVRFSPADTEEINRRAEKLYEYLDQQRKQLGLDPLAKDRPDVVDRYFEKTEGVPLDTDSEFWMRP